MRVQGQPPERAGRRPRYAGAGFPAERARKPRPGRADGGKRPARTAERHGRPVRDHRQIPAIRAGAHRRAVAARAARNCCSTHMPDLAEHFNRTASATSTRSRHVAVYGAYMSREPELRAADRGDRAPPRAAAAPGRPGEPRRPPPARADPQSSSRSFRSFVHVKFYPAACRTFRVRSACSSGTRADRTRAIENYRAPAFSRMTTISR